MREREPSRGGRVAEGSSPARVGFTLVECLVVVFVIGLLAAILLPAVHQAREASRRLECVNQLKQVALALQAYAGEHGCFPTVDSVTYQSGQRPGPPQAYSPLARILCELDQTALYNAFNFSVIPSVGAGPAYNLTAMSVTLGVALCPSDAPPPVSGYGRVNFRFSTGPTPWIGPSPKLPLSLDGPFTVGHFWAPGDFRDGLSNTVGISERLQGGWVKGAFKHGGDYLLVADGLWVVQNADQAVSLCASAPIDGPTDTRAGESWGLSGFHFTDYNHCATPNPLPNDCALDTHNGSLHSRTLHGGVFSASSGHPGGVNAALMDGSVRFIKNGIALPTWRALSTRSAGEVIGDY
jgi:prepilin-type N-terminal cleavage/methylation domain-containing protein/prepilin-type processing-associated H-X9-DG protein